MKGYIFFFFFPRKATPESLRITEITLTATAANIYNALLLNYIKLEMEKILRKNQNSLQRNQSTTSLLLITHRIIKGVGAKNIEATLLFIDFSRVKMEQILLAYDVHKETVTAIIMLYKSTKAMVHSLDGDSVFSDIVAGVL